MPRTRELKVTSGSGPYKCHYLGIYVRLTLCRFQGKLNYSVLSHGLALLSLCLNKLGPIRIMWSMTGLARIQNPDPKPRPCRDHHKNYRNRLGFMDNSIEAHKYCYRGSGGRTFENCYIRGCFPPFQASILTHRFISI